MNFKILKGYFLLLVPFITYSQNLPEWLLGNWENKLKEGSLMEEWMWVSDSKMFANSYFLNGNEKIPFETVDLIKENGKLHYIVTTQNQNNQQPVRLSSTKISENQIIFENKDHDFPQIITYTLLTSDSLVAEISGMVKGELKTQKFPMKKIQSENRINMKNNIYPCIWFDRNGKEAADFYIDIFGNGKIISESPVVVTFELSGQKFMALNGGPMFKPNPAISFMVIYENPDDLEKAWNKLSEGGFAMMALDKYDWSEKYGWLQDKFGVSWQLYLGKLDDVHGQKFIPTFMFTQQYNGKAEEAINFYMDVFKNTRSDGILKHEQGDMKGLIMHAQFVADEYVLMAMDGGEMHNFHFSEGNSMVIECDTQEEIDRFWNAFAEGGNESQCGWVQDRYGVWWQVIPAALEEWMKGPKAEEVMQALMKMNKPDIETLRKAAE